MRTDSGSILVKKNVVEAALRMAERSGKVAPAGEIQTNGASDVSGVRRSEVAEWREGASGLI